MYIISIHSLAFELFAIPFTLIRNWLFEPLFQTPSCSKAHSDPFSLSLSPCRWLVPPRSKCLVPCSKTARKERDRGGTAMERRGARSLASDRKSRDVCSADDLKFMRKLSCVRAASPFPGCRTFFLSHCLFFVPHFVPALQERHPKALTAPGN